MCISLQSNHLLKIILLNNRFYAAYLLCSDRLEIGHVKLVSNSYKYNHSSIQVYVAYVKIILGLSEFHK